VDPTAGTAMRTGVVLWLIFIALTCSYCLLYQAFVSSVTPDATRTLKLALWEWGVWMIATPLAFRRFDANIQTREHIRDGLAIALAAVAVPALIDQMTHTRTLPASLAIFVPRYLAVTLIAYLVWLVKVSRPREQTDQRVKNECPKESSQESSQPAHIQLPCSPPRTLLVSKGADQCIIRVDDIQYLSAAGNYIDILAQDQKYLMRTTMNQLEQLLPMEDFIRVHRSHIVRVTDIDRMKVLRSGNGFVHLRGGAKVPMSKSYRARLVQQHIGLAEHKARAH
jgi:DNA-binding LytR/AlgR family response regulator